MTCFHPIPAYYSKIPNPETGKYPLVFDYELADKSRESLSVPCRHCIGCLLDSARDLSVRAYHESLLFDSNVFVTLTYDNEHLPADRSVSKRTLQLFLKRLRKRFCEREIRYLACGEYGTRTKRAHYHLILFNLDFPDKIPFSRSKTGFINYVSKTLGELWPYGHHTINNVSLNSCGYVARYVTKKLFHSNNVKPVIFVDGHCYQVEPEFCLRSLKPGLGYDYFMRYYRDFYSVDACIIDGKKYSIPSYYDILLERIDSGLFEIIRKIRSENLEKYRLTGELHQSRLLVREAVLKHKTSRSGLLTREF